MKLHLPVRLFRAVIALMLAAPAALYAAYIAPTAITIPSGYTQVTVDALNDITAYSSTAGDVAFLIDAAPLANGLLTINGLTSALMTISTDSWYFTSYSAVNLASLTFSNATTRLFYLYSGESLTYTALKALLFEGNQHTYSGGAIYGYGSTTTISLSGNESVTFSGNTAGDDGGAIYGDGSSITLSGNESVTFSGNTASSTSYDVYGGAIYVCNGGAFTLSKNVSVTFSGNTASSTRASAYGGAIYGDYGCTIILSGNGNVTFSGRNKATYGGAIYGESNSITLSGNGSVTFSGNSASSQGGAIYGGDYSNITLSSNGSVTFCGNSASSQGGAIYGNFGCAITLSGNESVTFSGNTTGSRGGAIDGNFGCAITLSGNESVTFSGNKVRSYGYGGAIYIDDNLSICNNDSVLFEKNAEVSNGTYHLRSIYAGGIHSDIFLSAAEGYSIEFRDSIYIISGSTVNLNADYTDDKGVVHKQTGDIIFTGATTESDLLAVKGSAGTESEILNSRTSEVWALTTLHGGRLRVEDGAIYQGQGINVVAGSNATVCVKDAHLLHAGYELSFSAGSQLLLENNSFVSGDISMKAGSTLTIQQAAASDVCEILGGIRLEDGTSVSIILGGSLDLQEENKVLFYVRDGVSGWDASHVTLNEQEVSQHPLTLVDGLVILNYNEASFDLYYNGDFKYTDRWIGDLSLHHSQSIEFSSFGSDSGGGAIQGNSISLLSNGSVVFSKNKASSNGGAIDGGSITLSGNGSVTFSGNSANYGGAIDGGSISLSGNGSVTFSGNSANYGGAIYVNDNDALSICNNDSVLFEKNAEINNGSYRLRSIYAGVSSAVISLSAAEGKSIEFRDSVYIASGNTLNLNADYTNTGGVVHKQTGNIIFTGAYVEDDLFSVKGNVAGTAEEIQNSLTTEVNAMTHLYGGCLRVEDGAIYQGQGITAAPESNATVWVKDADLLHMGYELSFSAGSRLVLENNANVSGDISMKSGSSLTIQQGDASDFCEILGGIRLEEGVSVQLSLDASVLTQEKNNALLYCAGNAGPGWDSLQIKLNGKDAAQFDLAWVKGWLLLHYDESSFNPYFNGDISYTQQLENTANIRHYGTVELNNLSSSSKAGAINGHDVVLCGNETVIFRDNANRAVQIANNGFAYILGNENLTFCGNSGGVIYGGSYSTISMNHNGHVSFSGNSGTAIYGATINLRDNECLNFSENDGRAIYGAIVNLCNNGSVSIGEHTISSTSSLMYGGAIFGWGSILLSENGTVNMYRNTASADSYVYGGAIYVDEYRSVVLRDNDIVNFSENSVSASSDAKGGAIYGEYGSHLTLSGNGRVSFIENSADSRGGAMSVSSGSIKLHDNDCLIFSGNTANYGGAIYTDGNLSIQNNDSVLFEKNAELGSSGSYRLRSIYAEYGGSSVITLSAAEGKSIEFRDSLYISASAVNFNADYTDAEGVVHKQTGDIIFTGATTESDLLAVKGSAGTESEILNSRTSEIGVKATLYGGRLRVEDGAVYAGETLAVQAGSGASVRLKNGTVNAAMSFGDGTSLQVAGVNQASSITLSGETQWIFDLTAENVSAPALTLTGSLGINGHLTLHLSADGVLNTEADCVQLLSVTNVPGAWNEQNITVQSEGMQLSFADLSWDGTTLVLDIPVLKWNNGIGNGLWDGENANWLIHSSAGTFSPGKMVYFGDAGYGRISLQEELQPGSVLVDNSSGHDYEWVGDGFVGGKASLKKRGRGQLTICTANQYSGGTTLENGTLIAGSDAAFGTGDIRVEGGTLDANQRALANDIWATGGTLSGLSRYAGTLTVNGNVTLDSESATTAEAVLMQGGSLEGGRISGTTLHIAGGVVNSVLVGENTLADGTSLVGPLHNEGVLTVEGNIDASGLTLQYEAAGRVGLDGEAVAMTESGFGKSFRYSVKLADGSGSVVGDGAIITHEDADYGMTLRSDGVAEYGGDIDYGHFYLMDDVAYHVSSLEASTGKALRMVTMSGGELVVDTDKLKVDATSGAINLIQDTTLCGQLENVSLAVRADVELKASVADGSTLLLENGQLRLCGISHFDGAIVSSGTSSLSVQSEQPLRLEAAINNAGKLTLSGAFDLSSLENVALPSSWVNTRGEVATSGFATQGGYTVQMVQGGQVKDAGVILSYGDDTLTLDSNGVATRKGDVDYSHYTIITGASASLADINRVAQEHTCSTTSVSATGGSLTLDADVSGSLTLQGCEIVFGDGGMEVADTLTLGDEITISLKGSYEEGSVYTLISAGSIAGDCDGLLLPSSPRQDYTLFIEDNALKMAVVGEMKYLIWANEKKAVWQEGAGGWEDGESFFRGDHVTVGDGTVIIEGEVAPGSLTLNPTKALTFKTKLDKKTGEWSGAITGDTTVTIAAGPKGKVTLNDGNDYTGTTTIISGTVNVGGATSFGESKVTLSGGTLDLKGKAVANAITLAGEAAIKGGAKYAGEFTLNGGELQKGSVLNVAEKATLVNGEVSGTLSGIGTVYVTGEVELESTGKLTTSGLNITGTLNVGSKGLTMNAKSSAISIAGGTLESEGKLSAYSLTMQGGKLEMTNAKPMAVTLNGLADLSTKANVNLYGAFTAADLDMDGSTFTLAMAEEDITTKNQPKPQKLTLKDKNATSELRNGSTLDIMGSMTVAGALALTDSSINLHDVDSAAKPKAMGLTVKDALTIADENKDAAPELALTGKLSAARLTLDKADITLENETAAQSIALTLAKDTQKQVVVNSFTNSTIDATGSMTVAGALALTDSSISLHDIAGAAKPKAMGLTVKDALTIADAAKDAAAELALTGKLTAARLTLDKADIKLENETAAQSIALTLAKDTQKQVVVNSFTNSTIDATGSMTVAGALALTDSSISLHDIAGAAKPKAMGLTVKDALTIADAAKDAATELALTGKLTAARLTLDKADIKLENETAAQSIALTLAKDTQKQVVVNSFTNSTIDATGSMTVAGELEMTDSSINLHDIAGATKPKAMGLTVKGALDIADAAKDDATELYLTGKLTAGSMNLTNADITLENELAAQSIALTMAKGADKLPITNTFVHSTITANGSMTVAGNLSLADKSSITLEDKAKGKAMNLAVKGDLFLSDSSITLSGALSAANMTLNGGSINLTSTKLQTIKVSKELTFGGSITLGLQEGLDIKMGKSYNLFTYKTLAGVDETTNLYDLLGLADEYCTLTLDLKKKAITLMVTEEEWNQWVTDHTTKTELEPEEAPIEAVAATAAEVEPGITTAAAVEEELPEEEEAEATVVTTTLPVQQAADVEALIAKVSDTLVQTTWGTAKASRAFVDSIGNRGQNATALAEGRGAAWGGVIGATSRLSSHGGSLGADHTLSGAVFGAEMNATPHHSIGLAMGVTWGEINTLSAYNVDQDSTHLAAYGQSRLGKSLTLDWSAAYGRSENDADILGSSYDWTQHALQLDARLSYAYALNERTTLRGFGGMQYLHIDSDTPEKGMKADSMQNVRVEVGVGATYMARAKTALYGEVSFIGDILRDNPATHIGGICRGGSNPGRAGMNMTVGATHALNENWSLNASYNMELQPRANAHNATIGATYRF